MWVAHTPPTPFIKLFPPLTTEHLVFSEKHAERFMKGVDIAIGVCTE